MARKRDDIVYKQKRHEIIQYSIGMIMMSGYKTFSLNQLLIKMNMSKGVFFHYFKSKDELTEAVVDFASQTIIERINTIADSSSLNPIEKIMKIYEVSSEQTFQYDDKGELLAQNTYSQMNKEFIDLITLASLETFRNFFLKVLHEGNEQNYFKISHVIGTANQIMNLTLGTNKLLSDFILGEKTAASKAEVLETLEVFNSLMSYLTGVEFKEDLYKINLEVLWLSI